MNSKNSNFTLGTRKIFELFNGEKNYEIPLYQRSYTWGKEHINSLIDDIIYNINNDDDNKHYFGIIATTETVDIEPTKIHWTRIIDGQQRITTSILIIHILLEQIGIEKNKKGGIGVRFGSINFRYEIETNLSKEITKILKLSGNTKELDKKGQIYKAILIIKEHLKKHKQYSPELLLDTFLHKFILGELNYEIERNEEMLVFENLNSKGSPLTNFDLIKNHFISLEKGPIIEEMLKKFNNRLFNLVKDGKYKVPQQKQEKIFEEFIENYIYLK